MSQTAGHEQHREHDHHHEHHHKPATFLHSGAGTLCCVLGGLLLGQFLPHSTLLEDLLHVYSRLFALVALPYLTVTLLHSISRFGAMENAERIGSYFLRAAAVAALSIAITGAAVTLAVNWLIPFDKVTAQALADVAHARESGEDYVATVSLHGKHQAAHGPELLHSLLSLAPGNIFESLAAGAVQQVLVFMVIFAIALVTTRRHGAAPRLSVLEGVQRVLQEMLEKLLFFGPVAVLALAASASSVTSFSTIEHLRVLMIAQIMTSVLVILGAAALTAYVTRRSITRTLSAMSGAVIAAVIGQSEEAALPFILRGSRIRCGRPAGEMLASLSLLLGQFGVIGCVASASTYIFFVYGVPLTPSSMLSLLGASIIGSVVFGAGPVGPTSLAGTMAFVGASLQLPAESAGLAIAVLEPLLEFAVIPAGVATCLAIVAAAPPGNTHNR